MMSWAFLEKPLMQALRLGCELIGSRRESGEVSFARFEMGAQ
jgi:hypothetical protein